MPDTVTLSGTVADLFAHRFTLRTEGGLVLADLGPKGADAVKLAAGDAVTVVGEAKPSEVKVRSITRGGDTLVLPHGDEPRPEHHALSPKDRDAAREAAATAGLQPIGEPRRRPKHVEVLARDAAGRHHELHVGLDGTLRQRKPVAAGDATWKAALGNA